MLCPHCRTEHPEDVQVCPNTGLPIGHPVVCLNCGRIARQGASYCAACGATLPRERALVSEGLNLSEAGSLEGVPSGSQGITRPSISLVERSRRKTRTSQIAIPTSTKEIQQWAQQNRAWHVFGYALLFLVLLAGAAGLYLVWYQLH